jgi:uncharacterized protein YlzI (FlbEa/FlbD family)
MQNNFGKKDLLEALKNADKKNKDIKIPSSYKSLIRLEKIGIIPNCISPIKFSSGRKWRVYSREEIDNIITRIIDYKRANKAKND